jgi:hypothetical protein
MTTLAIDTYKILQRLESKGYSRQQAEGFIDVLQDIDFDNFATKSDIKDLRAEMREMGLQLTIRLGGMIMGLGAVLIAIKYYG